LYEHDCVIVPGFGGLVANYRSAKLNATTHFIVPPAKHIGFNRNLVRNDGLLANHIAHVLNVSYTDAVTHVEECVADYRKRLEADARIVWDKIGFLFLDKTGNLQFIPDEQENFLLDSFGLQGIQLRPVMSPSNETKVVEMVPVVGAKRKNSAWIAAAAIALPVIAAGVFFMSQGTNQNGMQLSIADLNPFSKNISSEYAQRKNTEPIQQANLPTENSFEKALNESKTDTVRFSFSDDGVSENGILVIKEKSSSDVLPEGHKKEKASAATSETKSNATSSLGKYALIAGAFQVEQNAKNFIQQLSSKGFSAHRAGTNRGLHLVAIGSYNTKEEAKNAQQNIRQGEGIKVWVKRIK